MSSVWEPSNRYTTYRSNVSAGMNGCRNTKIYDFLLSPRKAATRPVWIRVGQLCLDQNNTAQRSRRADHTSSIFTRASLLEAWLEPAFVGSHRAVEFQVGLSKRADEPSRHEITKHHEPSGYEITKHHEPSAHEITKHRPALPGIVESPYWSRLWVVREPRLSWSAIVRPGNRTMS